MAILNSIITKMSGSVGSLVFKTVGGRTVVSEKPAKISNPRTPAQMATRTKLTNIIQMYKGIRPLLKNGFEGKPFNLSDYNVFVRLNMQQAPVFLTKQMVAGGACIAAPYTITQGSLPSIVITGEGRNATTNIFIAGLTLGASTTVADFSKAVVDNNPDYRYGDQISYFIIKQKVNETTGVPYCQFKANSVILDASNDAKLWEVVPKNGFSAQDGCLAHNGNDGDCVFAWVHSRKSNGKTLVSTQQLIDANSKLSQYQGDAAQLLAANSYGVGDSAFLTPDSDAISTLNTNPGTSTTPGGGDSI